MSGTAVSAQKEIEPGTGALQRTIRRRNVDLEGIDLIRGFCPFINAHPDARLLGNDFALSIVGSTARTVSKLLGAGLRTHVLQIRNHAIAAGLATEGRR